MAAPFKRQQVADKDLQLVQDNVADALSPLQAIPMVGGNVVAPTKGVLQGPADQAGILINTTSTPIAHGLNRVPRYWILLGLDRNAVVFNATGAAWDNKYIYLQASTACFAILWVN